MSAPQWYGVYDLATGTLLSVGTVLADPMSPTLGVSPVPAGETYDVTVVWDVATRSWVPKPPDTTDDIGKGDFMRRLGFAREVVLRVVMLDPSQPIQLRAQLQTLDAWLSRAEIVNVTDPITVSGVSLMAQVLDAAGDLPEGVAAFTNAMLAPVVIGSAEDSLS